MTLIVNLYGGPGSGKSTLSAGVFCELKTRGVNCELTHEPAKEWAWQGRVPCPIDEFTFFGEKVRQISALLGRVDVIITDSPLWLSPAFAEFHKADRSIIDTLKDASHAVDHELGVAGHRQMDIWVKRSDAYQTSGRFQTEDEAHQLDDIISMYACPEGRFYTRHQPRSVAGDVILELARP